jgi:hypothetical protein
MLLPYSVGVYVDTDTCQFHFNNLDYNNIVCFSNIDDFLRSKFKISYAAFHVPFDKHDKSWIDRINLVYDFVDRIYIFCSELHDYTFQSLCLFDKPKVSIFLCGVINHEFRDANLHRWLDWFVTSVHFYKVVDPKLLEKKLVNNTTKKYFFDILLGCQRPHRDYIYNFINQNNMDSHVLMTYHRFWNVDLRQADYITEDEGVEYLEIPMHSHHVRYYNYKMILSQIVPITIYNNSYYSLVAETNAVNEFNFYTEKIVKPILAKRLFIVVAGQGYLKNLRSFGFKTFSSVIDESYDNEENQETRFRMALEQFKYLIGTDPVIIENKIKDIVEHNQKLMLNHDWYNELSISLRNELEKDFARITVD